jgi:MFS family permease
MENAASGPAGSRPPRTLGLFLSLAVILLCRTLLSREDFAAWGWRIPFWLSLLLVAFSYYIRRRMNESPLFARMKASARHHGTHSRSRSAIAQTSPWCSSRSSAQPRGQGVVWYTGQFYAMNFIKLTLGVDATQTEYLVGIALLIGTPFFIVFGALSDRIGRKPIILTGCVLAVLTYYPIYNAKRMVVDLKDTARYRLVDSEQIGASARGEGRGGRRTPARTVTTVQERRDYADGTRNLVTITRTPTDGAASESVAEKNSIKFASLKSPPALMLMLLVLVQVLYVTMVYGPIAAFLVELFPTRIRYSSMSLPYHIGNGVFGGMVPFIGQLLVVRTGNPLAGLWYPMAVAAVTVVVGLVWVRERRGVRMWDEETP